MGNPYLAPQSGAEEKSAIPKRDFSALTTIFSTLLGLLIFLLLMKFTDLPWNLALPLSFAISAMIFGYLSHVIPLILAGKYSMENVARDMVKVAESLQEASKGNIGAFREAKEHIMGAIEETEASLLPSETPVAPIVAPKTAEETMIDRISIAAKSVCFGSTLEEAARRSGIPYMALKDMHDTKHPLWVRLCKSSQSQLTDAMLHQGVTDGLPDE